MPPFRPQENSTICHGSLSHCCDKTAAAEIAYLWQILGEVVTKGSEGLAANGQVVVGAALVQTLAGGAHRSVYTSNTN